jgi:hypothetical protein
MENSRIIDGKSKVSVANYIQPRAIQIAKRTEPSARVAVLENDLTSHIPNTYFQAKNSLESTTLLSRWFQGDG